MRAICVALSLLFCALSVGLVHGKRIPWWSIKIAQEQGPNACVVEEIPGSSVELWTECRYWINRKICGQNTIIRYECCEGYQRLEADQGCTAVKPLRNLLDTAEDLGARKFVAAIREAGLAQELTRDGAFTLLAPTDSAFDRMSERLRATLMAGEGGPDNPILLYHMLDGKLTTKDMGADQLVETKNSGTKVRFNKYSNQMTTVNCHLLLRKDQKATNGIVHVVNEVLDPARINSASLVDLVTQDGRFSVLAEAMESSGYIQELRRMPNAFTIFAPSDEAFQKLPQSRRDKIINDKVARDALLRNHVIRHPICKSAVLGKHNMRSQAQNKMEFNCDRDAVFVNQLPMRSEPMLAQNGVMHMLDDVLIPDRAKNFLELADKYQLTTFGSLVRSAGLEEAFGDYGDYTIFVPDDTAFYNAPSELIEAARSDTEVARKLLLYHATQGRLLSKAISDNQVVMSLDEENPLRLQVHRKAPGVEDAMIRQADIQGQNGVMHIIDKLLVPSNQSAGDILRREGGFSLFLQAMEKVMAADPRSLELKNQGTYTFFVPNDEAFKALGDAKMHMMMDDVDFLTETVRHHISERMLSTGSFQPDLTYQIASKHGTLDVRASGDQLMVGDARILKRDVVNTNGIIHVIDKVLLPSHEDDSYSHYSKKSFKSKTYGKGSSRTYRRYSSSSRRRYSTGPRSTYSYHSASRRSNVSG